GFKGGSEFSHFVIGAASLNGFKQLFSSDQAALHGGMRAFDLGEVQGAGIAANHHAARESHLRQTVQTAFGDGAGTIGNALAVFQVLFHHRVVLHALEFIKGADVRIAVRQVRNQTDHNLVIFRVIQEEATGRTGFAQRPAGTVQYQAFFMVGRVNIPQLFDTNAVVLRIFAFIQLELADQALAQVAATAFGKDGVLGTQFHARGVFGFGFAIGVHAHVAGHDAFNSAVFNDVFSGGEARVDFYAQCFGLLAQPATDVTQGNNVVALVVHGLGDHPVRSFYRLFGAGQEINFITFNRHIERGTQLFPVREQLSQGTVFDNGTGQNMGADFGAFFNQ